MIGVARYVLAHVFKHYGQPTLQLVSLLQCEKAPLTDRNQTSFVSMAGSAAGPAKAGAMAALIDLQMPSASSETCTYSATKLKV